MLRLTVLLCASMFVTLLIAGEDNGQMRPGLAAAIAEGREIVVLERRRAPVEEPAVVAAVAAKTPDMAEPKLVEAAFVPEERLPAPVTPTRRVIAEPIFTLSALPTVTRDEMAAETTADTGSEPALIDGQVWYVSASSVNVRQGPSTDTSVMAKLSRGEAVTVSYLEGDEWARVSIEGDGVAGYVAVRFLSASAP